MTLVLVYLWLPAFAAGFAQPHVHRLQGSAHRVSLQRVQHRACLSAARAEADDEWPLLRDVRRAVHDYALIQPGDRIAVAVSGGKDSSTLAFLLKRLKERRLLPFDDWSFTTVHLDQVQPGHDAQSLEAWLEGEGIDFHLLREDTYSVVTEKTRPGASYCSLCSRLRRGILYTAAAELKSNRLALGHHRDDALETLLLNMVHQGQLKALPARYRARRGIDVIRFAASPSCRATCAAPSRTARPGSGSR